MRIMLLIIIIGILAVSGFAAYYIRTISHDVAVWHVDPTRALPQPTPNGFYIGPPEQSAQPTMDDPVIYAGTPEILAQAFDAYVMAQPLVELVAGSPEEAWMTYVQRTEKLRIPDYVSVKFLPGELEGTSTISIFSRSRFGYSDMGVNEARVRAWLVGLSSFEQ